MGEAVFFLNRCGRGGENSDIPFAQSSYILQDFYIFPRKVSGDLPRNPTASVKKMKTVI